MKKQDNIEYYAMRERAALAQAESAADLAIRNIHLTMASEYRRRLGDAAMEAGPMSQAV